MQPLMPVVASIRLVFAVLILGRLAMLAIWALVPSKADPLLIMSVLCLDAVVLLVQVGLIRQNRRAFGSSAALALLVLLAVLAAGMLVATGLNRLAGSQLNPPPAVPRPAALAVEDGIVRLSGDISFMMFENMRVTLTSSHTVRTVSLNSEGGRIAAARGIARLVREAGLNTDVSGTCASACTLILAAGHERTMSEGGRVGFHGYWLMSGIATVNTAEEQDRDKAQLVAQGISPDFLDRAFETPHSEMWFPDRNELLAAGVLTQ